MSLFVEHDFLPAKILAGCFVMVVANPRPDLFNMGGGFAQLCGRIAEWLVKGHGSGTLLVVSCRDHDGFWQDMIAAAKARPFCPAELRRHCVAAGRLLQQEGRG